MNLTWYRQFNIPRKSKKITVKSGKDPILSEDKFLLSLDPFESLEMLSRKADVEGIDSKKDKIDQLTVIQDEDGWFKLEMLAGKDWRSRERNGVATGDISNPLDSYETLGEIDLDMKIGDLNISAYYHPPFENRSHSGFVGMQGVFTYEFLDSDRWDEDFFFVYDLYVSAVDAYLNKVERRELVRLISDVINFYILEVPSGINSIKIDKNSRIAGVEDVELLLEDQLILLEQQNNKKR